MPKSRRFPSRYETIKADFNRLETLLWSKSQAYGSSPPFHSLATQRKEIDVNAVNIETTRYPCVAGLAAGQKEMNYYGFLATIFPFSIT
jgi:hypothetical protein